MSRFVRLAAIALLGAASLAACGHRSSLERPPPMWGDARARYDAEQRARQEAERARQAAQQAQQQQQAPDATTPLNPPPDPPPPPTQ